MSKTVKRVALVTGASSGIGKDFALQVLREGYIVYGAARRVERMAEIEAAGGVSLAMDVTDDTTMTAAINRISRIKDASTSSSIMRATDRWEL